MAKYFKDFRLQYVAPIASPITDAFECLECGVFSALVSNEKPLTVYEQHSENCCYFKSRDGEFTVVPSRDEAR